MWISLGSNIVTYDLVMMLNALLLITHLISRLFTSIDGKRKTIKKKTKIIVVTLWILWIPIHNSVNARRCCFFHIYTKYICTVLLRVSSAENWILTSTVAAVTRANIYPTRLYTRIHNTQHTIRSVVLVNVYEWLYRSYRIFCFPFFTYSFFSFCNAV